MSTSNKAMREMLQAELDEANGGTHPLGKFLIYIFMAIDDANEAREEASTTLQTAIDKGSKDFDDFIKEWNKFQIDFADYKATIRGKVSAYGVLGGAIPSMLTILWIIFKNG